LAYGRYLYRPVGSMLMVLGPVIVHPRSSFIVVAFQHFQPSTVRVLITYKFNTVLNARVSIYRTSVVISRFTLELRSAGAPKVHMLWDVTDQSTELDSYSFSITSIHSRFPTRIPQQSRTFRKSSVGSVGTITEESESIQDFPFDRADTRMDV
jgi:hypothetical protein